MTEQNTPSIKFMVLPMFFIIIGVITPSFIQGICTFDEEQFILSPYHKQYPDDSYSDALQYCNDQLDSGYTLLAIITVIGLVCVVIGVIIYLRDLKSTSQSTADGSRK